MQSIMTLPMHLPHLYAKSNLQGPETERLSTKGKADWWREVMRTRMSVVSSVVLVRVQTDLEYDVHNLHYLIGRGCRTAEPKFGAEVHRTLGFSRWGRMYFQSRSMPTLRASDSGWAG